MKKVLFSFLAIVGLAVFCSFTSTSVTTANVNETSDQEILLASSSTRTVPCVKFNGNITIRTQGHYDPDDNTITIAGNTYSVRKNPYYGDGSKRGEYYYKAGDYYFDL